MSARISYFRLVIDVDCKHRGTPDPAMAAALQTAAEKMVADGLLPRGMSARVVRHACAVQYLRRPGDMADVRPVDFIDTWRCLRCGQAENVTYGELADSGVPSCSNCDVEMVRNSR